MDTILNIKNSDRGIDDDIGAKAIFFQDFTHKHTCSIMPTFHNARVPPLSVTDEKTCQAQLPVQLGLVTDRNFHHINLGTQLIKIVFEISRFVIPKPIKFLRSSSIASTLH